MGWCPPHPYCLIQRLCDSTLSCIFNKSSRDCDVTSKSISLEASCPCCQCPNKLHKHRFPSCLCVAGMQCLSRLRCGAMWNSFTVLQYVLQAVPCYSSQIRSTVSLNAPYPLCCLRPSAVISSQLVFLWSILAQRAVSLLGIQAFQTCFLPNNFRFKWMIFTDTI